MNVRGMGGEGMELVRALVLLLYTHASSPSKNKTGDEPRAVLLVSRAEAAAGGVVHGGSVVHESEREGSNAM